MQPKHLIMRRKLSKKETVSMFLETWRESISFNRKLRGDAIAKRTAFNDFVDGLNKDGLVSDHQVYTWSNPF